MSDTDKTSATFRALRGYASPSDVLALVIPALGERVPGSCWDCGHDVLMMRPDPAMRGLSDQIVCGACGETQPEVTPNNNREAGK